MWRSPFRTHQDVLLNAIPFEPRDYNAFESTLRRWILIHAESRVKWMVWGIESFGALYKSTFYTFDLGLFLDIGRGVSGVEHMSAESTLVLGSGHIPMQFKTNESQIIGHVYECVSREHMRVPIAARNISSVQTQKR